MNDKTEFQFPNTEHGDSAPSVNDVQLAEARSAVEALAFARGANNPETYRDPAAVELLQIGRKIEDYRLAA